MNFSDYQKKAITTYIGPSNDPDRVKRLFALITGLCGESGEVAEKLKKLMRDKDLAYGPSDAIELEKELGDVLWYLSALADYFGINLQDLAQNNLEKVLSRQSRGVQAGSGDNR